MHEEATSGRIPDIVFIRFLFRSVLINKHPPEEVSVCTRARMYVYARVFCPGEKTGHGMETRVDLLLIGPR